MNLYLLKQNVNDDWDTYDSCIVAAPNEQEAKEISPSSKHYDNRLEVWAAIEDIQCTLIGTAIEGTEKGVILSSYNAG